jgi:hypothetical protein
MATSITVPGNLKAPVPRQHTDTTKLKCSSQPHSTRKLKISYSCTVKINTRVVPACHREDTKKKMPKPSILCQCGDSHHDLISEHTWDELCFQDITDSSYTIIEHLLQAPTMGTITHGHQTLCHANAYGSTWIQETCEWLHCSSQSALI